MVTDSCKLLRVSIKYYCVYKSFSNFVRIVAQLIYFTLQITLPIKTSFNVIILYMKIKEMIYTL